MPSLISQMRNGTIQPQAQLNNSIQQVKQLMQLAQGSANPQAFLMQQFPQLAPLVQNKDLKSVAEQMARERGINLQQLISQLQEG